MAEVILIIAICTLIGCVVGIYFVSNYDNVVSIMYKTSLSEKDIDEKLKNVEDLINRCVNIIERQLNTSFQSFEPVKNIKSDKLNIYDKDLVLSNAAKEINKIYSDYSELEKVKSFKGIIDDINKFEIELKALRGLYNNYAAKYNKKIRMIPNNITAKIKKMKLKSFYDTGELDKELANL